MKAVILAGGLGSRLSEETHLKPKPMVELAGKPILWHIMKSLSAHGITEFIICLGYKGYIVKEYFANYFLHNSDVTMRLKSNEMEVHSSEAEDWVVTLLDTGEHTQTAGRLRRVSHLLEGETKFLFTYGDGLSDVDIAALVDKHEQAGLLATVTAVRPPGRYGSLVLQENKVSAFSEKVEGQQSWINGGFFLLDPKVFTYLKADSESWEMDTLPRLVSDNQLGTYCHEGFWHAMDTLRDRNHLESLITDKKAPWMNWEQRS